MKAAAEEPRQAVECQIHGCLPSSGGILDESNIEKWSTAMDEKQEQNRNWIQTGIKLALSLAALFPVYMILFVTFPASLVAVYLIGAVLVTLFAPWEDLKKKFLA